MAQLAEGFSAAFWASKMHLACSLVYFSAVGGTLNLPSAEWAIYYMSHCVKLLNKFAPLGIWHAWEIRLLERSLRASWDPVPRSF